MTKAFICTHTVWIFQNSLTVALKFVIITNSLIMTFHLSACTFVSCLQHCIEFVLSLHMPGFYWLTGCIDNIPNHRQPTIPDYQHLSDNQITQYFKLFTDHLAFQITCFSVNLNKLSWSCSRWHEFDMLSYLILYHFELSFTLFEILWVLFWNWPIPLQIWGVFQVVWHVTDEQFEMVQYYISRRVPGYTCTILSRFI